MRTKIWHCIVFSGRDAALRRPDSAARCSYLCFGVLLAMLSLLFAGCKSTPKVDWNSRIGNYTYDQAVTELGPPDKTAKLSDGKTVADWIKHSHGGGLSFGAGTGFYGGGGTAVGTGVGTSTGYPDRVLRLTFGPDGKLLEFKKE